MIINTNQIEKLVNDKTITGYSIHKATGISQTAISRLRNDPERIGNITLETAKQLQAFINKGETTMTNIISTQVNLSQSIDLREISYEMDFDGIRVEHISFDISENPLTVEMQDELRERMIAKVNDFIDSTDPDEAENQAHDFIHNTLGSFYDLEKEFEQRIIEEMRTTAIRELEDYIEQLDDEEHDEFLVDTFFSNQNIFEAGVHFEPKNATMWTNDLADAYAGGDRNAYLIGDVKITFAADYKLATQDNLTELINDYLDDLKQNDPELATELFDWYYEPANQEVYFVTSGMAYDGSDKSAFEVAQSKNGEITNWR